MTDAEVEGNRFKVVWSCLLLLEMVMDDVACAAHFQTLATNVVGKVAELFRLFNTRSTQLVLGAGAIHSAARLKSINAKHLSIVTQCIALILAILPHVRAALMAQLPPKQHALLSDMDKIKQDYSEHNEKILCKLVSIIGGIVEHSLAAKIPQTNFDRLASTGEEIIDCSPFIDSVVTNTKKMHQVLNVILPPELLRDVFSRIFAYLDHKVPSLYKDFAADPNAPNKPRFSMPTSNEGKRRLVREVEYMTKTLNCLAGVQPWHFTAMKVLEQELDIEEEESTLLQSDEKKEADDNPPVSNDSPESSSAASPLLNSESKQLTEPSSAASPPVVEQLIDVATDAKTTDQQNPDSADPPSVSPLNGDTDVEEAQMNGKENAKPLEIKDSEVSSANPQFVKHAEDAADASSINHDSQISPEHDGSNSSLLDDPQTTPSYSSPPVEDKCTAAIEEPDAAAEQNGSAITATDSSEMI
jgi:hypothetical protein